MADLELIQLLENAKARVQIKINQIQGYPVYRNDVYAWSLIEQMDTIDSCLALARAEEGEEI
jgi:hypothetical protein